MHELDADPRFIPISESLALADTDPDEFRRLSRSWPKCIICGDRVVPGTDRCEDCEERHF
jgi:hypothetical protein